MKSTEELSKRLKRVDMHDYFLNRIALAMKNNNYIEASWLIYSCFRKQILSHSYEVPGKLQILPFKK